MLDNIVYSLSASDVAKPKLGSDGDTSDSGQVEVESMAIGKFAAAASHDV